MPLALEHKRNTDLREGRKEDFELIDNLLQIFGELLFSNLLALFSFLDDREGICYCPSHDLRTDNDEIEIILTNLSSRPMRRGMEEEGWRKRSSISPSSLQ
jgi:hypothetical protein